MGEEMVKMGGEPLLRISEALFKSQLFPNVRNAFGAFAVVEYGHELGIGPMTSLQSMSIVQGKICMAGQMMLSLALKSGVTYKITVDTVEKCEVQFTRGTLTYTSSFSIAEAKTAGIFKAQGGWEKYPRDMLFWRTVTRGLRRVCPDVILGLYAKEEIEDAPPLNASAIEVTPSSEPTEEKATEKDVPLFITIQIKEFETKPYTNKKTGKPSEYFIITDENNIKYRTFDTGIAKIAVSENGTNSLMLVKFEIGKFGNEIIALERQDQHGENA
jgi:hypothetical protein